MAAATGLATMALFGRLLLPSRGGVESGAEDADGQKYLSELVVAADSPFIGRQVGAIAEFRPDGLRVLGLRRGGKVHREGVDEHELRRGDTLIVVATVAELLTILGGRGAARRPAGGADARRREALDRRGDRDAGARAVRRPESPTCR